jgi:hypothetical protein
MHTLVTSSCDVLLFQMVNLTGCGPIYQMTQQLFNRERGGLNRVGVEKVNRMSEILGFETDNENQTVDSESDDFPTDSND